MENPTLWCVLPEHLQGSIGSDKQARAGENAGKRVGFIRNLFDSRRGNRHHQGILSAAIAWLCALLPEYSRKPERRAWRVEELPAVNGISGTVKQGVERNAMKQSMRNDNDPVSR